jgi:1-acyl-sn-glycerol-3-phosphate acyltransferase
MTNSALTRTYRITRMFLHLATGLAASSLVFPFVGRKGRLEIFRRWSLKLLDIMAVRVRLHGAPPLERLGPTMLLSNHVSWLDIYLIASSVPSRFVAKSEIRGWPVIGWLIARQGTLFVERARRHDTARINGSVHEALAKGYCVAVFPEGTTSDGTEVKPFHASLLQPIVQAHGVAIPVALRYVTADGAIDNSAAYIADRTLWSSMKLIASNREVFADVIFLPPVSATGKHRRDLAQHTARLIADALCLPAPDRKRGTASGLPAEPPSALAPTDIPYPAREAAVRP